MPYNIYDLGDAIRVSATFTDADTQDHPPIAFTFPHPHPPSAATQPVASYAPTLCLPSLPANFLASHSAATPPAPLHDASFTNSTQSAGRTGARPAGPTFPQKTNSRVP